MTSSEMTWWVGVINGGDGDDEKGYIKGNGRSTRKEQREN